jgi:hypothetical protein
MYGQVNWDKKVPKKLHAPVTTYERKADPLKPDPNPYTRPQIWQVNNSFGLMIIILLA